MTAKVLAPTRDLRSFISKQVWEREVALSAWVGNTDSYIDALVWLVGKMLADPEHFYRSYTAAELDNLMAVRPTGTPGLRVREMNLYRRYFDLVADGSKTIEFRVQYPNLRSLAAGDYIRFVCGRDDALTRVKRVARYATFEELLNTEGPEKEALGVLAIEIELVASPTP